MVLTSPASEIYLLRILYYKATFSDLHYVLNLYS
jgi:hypothetical protein